MNTLDRIIKAIEKSDFSGMPSVDDNGRFSHIVLRRSSGNFSNQKVYFSESPSKMTIKKMVTEINNSIHINNPQGFIDTH